MKSEVKLSSQQYGGIKGISTEHFLIDTWNSVFNSLEGEGSAASLVSIDFEKAFNRMDHAECLNALTNLGASELVRKWIAAFLYNRTMSVRIRDTMSHPRPVPGGSPQGSILGNFLFCVTTDQFAGLASKLTPPGGRNEDVTMPLELNGVDVSICLLYTSDAADE